MRPWRIAIRNSGVWPILQRVRVTLAMSQTLQRCRECSHSLAGARLEWIRPATSQLSALSVGHNNTHDDILQFDTPHNAVLDDNGIACRDLIEHRIQ